MKLIFSERSWEEYVYWQDQDTVLLSRINLLIRDIARSPFVGIGHPEPLRGNKHGWWSRRITQEHRLVYRVTGKGDEKALEIASCRFHYGD
ncbi:MAG: Txe/YoeB family addiction module toxin [Mesorhizobium sp.]|nr:Txe/YoeB family addiction module toxin [Mesorhizobium sp.]